MSIEPGTLSILGRSAYYLAEAERVHALAVATPEDEGRAYFEEVAREYRLLAAYYAPEDPAEREPLKVRRQPRPPPSAPAGSAGSRSAA